MLNIKTADYEAGQLLLIDKPIGWTSFDVVNKLRYTLKVKKIGHAGTLDPLATGLLIICTGKKTKEIQQYQDQHKEYTGTFTLGHTTPSFDLETTPENPKDISQLSEKDIIDAAQQFLGNIAQIPPMHSAIKIDGSPAYLSARKGKTITMPPRQVEILAFDLTAFRLPEVDFRVACSKGTYIRSLARDVGEQLGVGAYLSALRRTKIGDFEVKNAWQLQDFVSNFS